MAFTIGKAIALLQIIRLTAKTYFGTLSFFAVIHKFRYVTIIHCPLGIFIFLISISAI